MSEKPYYLDYLKGLNAITSQVSATLRVFNQDNYNTFLGSAAKPLAMNAVVEDIANRQALLVDADRHSAVQVFRRQWDALAKIRFSANTPELNQLKISLLDNNVCGIETFVDSLNATRIAAPNVALLKNARIFENASLSLPRGLASVVKDIHVETARRLANSQDIGLDVVAKMFYVISKPDEKATALEMNVLCSSLQFLSDLSEAELIEFMNELEKNPSFASAHPVGEKIDKIIMEWREFMTFDRKVYYHARALKEGECPYTEQTLRQTPYGRTGHGRYNHVGHSHYYFSDTSEGAKREVLKHSKENRVQIATLRPNRVIRMIDLSAKTTRPNLFLDYCRFEPDPKEDSLIRRAYLLPCYVAESCGRHYIEGIKYYGSKKHYNYVSWNDSYFDYVGSKIEPSK